MSENKNKLTDKQVEKLVERSQKGDSEAFSQIYDEYVNQLYKYIYYKVKKEDVEDLTETLFLKAWENIGKYKNRKNTSFRSWLYRIAHNLVVDHYRLTREHVSLDTRISSKSREADPKEMAQNVLDNENLKVAISKLKKNYRQIIVLKFINELSNKEICKVLKKSEGSVRILQYRALKALRQIIDEMGVRYAE
jgi:RNA polymerase sigma-70 factor (ECF subfamily)